MPVPIDDVQQYILDMLEQLAELARRDRREKLAARIETVVSAEQSDILIGVADARINQSSPGS